MVAETDHSLKKEQSCVLFGSEHVDSSLRVCLSV